MRRVALLAFLACLGAAVPAHAAGVQTLYDEYLSVGAVSGCGHTSGELESALSSIPADIVAYDPGFEQALNAALEQRASGCNRVSEQADELRSDYLGGAISAPDGSPGPPPAPLRSALSPPPAPETPGSPIVAIPLAVGIGAAALTCLFTMLPAGRRPRRSRHAAP